jgi:hypothetical protein
MSISYRLSNPYIFKNSLEPEVRKARTGNEEIYGKVSRQVPEDKAVP